MIDDVEKFGWHCVGVAPLPEDPPEVYSFAYTVGLEQSFGHPELITLELPFEVGHGFLNAAVDRIHNGGTFAAGERTSALIEDGARVAFREVSDERRLDHLTYADWFYSRKGFRALQLIWPDSSGNLPGDAGYPEGNPDQVMRPQ